MIGLKYFASGGDWKNIAEKFGVSSSTVSRCANLFADVISRDANNWISFPRDADTLNQYSHDFFTVANFPDCIGAVDGTLIRITKPVEEEHIYVCRKGFHAINTLLICNAHLLILYCNAKYPGSTHDSFIYRSSNIWAAFDNNEIPRGLLLGDSGFRLEPRLMTPYLNAAGDAQELFNRAHRRTRCVIERCNGVLKSRFRCLDISGGTIRLKPNKAGKVILACCVLHNRATMGRIPLPALEMDEPHVDHNDHIIHDYTQTGQRQRVQITHLLNA